MPRLYTHKSPQGDTLVLTGEESRYINNVLRMHRGDSATFIGPDGLIHLAEIVSVSKGKVEARVLSSHSAPHEPESGVVLLQGILKGQKMDMVVQKTTELGVKNIVPLITERTQVRETRKLDRWQTIAKEAARQCGRTVIPNIEEPVAIGDCFASLPSAVEGFIFWEEGGESLAAGSLPEKDSDIYVAVGPEGGFTPGEVETAKSAGLRVVSLGPRILRAETAAISSVTLLQFLRGALEG